MITRPYRYNDFGHKKKKKEKEILLYINMQQNEMYGIKLHILNKTREVFRSSFKKTFNFLRCMILGDGLPPMLYFTLRRWRELIKFQDADSDVS